jgi:hypothetical protein
MISDYNIWPVIGDGSVGLHLLIPQYDYIIIIIVVVVVVVVVVVIAGPSGHAV